MKHIPPFGGGPEDVYIDRSLETGTPGSKVPAAFFNIVLAELLNLIIAAGIEPSDEDFTQIEQAVRALANFNIATLTEQAAIEPDDFLPFLDMDAGDTPDERKIKAGDLLSRFMGGRMTIAADANWNTLVTPGMYNTTGSAYSNGPLGASAHPGTLWIIGRSQSENHATQMFFYSAATPAIWTRTTTDGGANWSAWREILFLHENQLHVQDQRTSGTNGGSVTGGAWYGRTLNTVVDNTITGASLGSNQITLPAGTYDLDAFCSFGTIGGAARIRLRNVTDGTTIAEGLNGSAQASGAGGGVAVLKGKFTLGATKVLAIEARTGGSQANTGDGLPLSSGAVEIYSDIHIRKVA